MKMPVIAALLRVAIRIMRTYEIMFDTARFRKAALSITLDGSKQATDTKRLYDEVLGYQSVFFQLQMVGILMIGYVWGVVSFSSILGYTAAAVFFHWTGFLWATKSLIELESNRVDLNRWRRRNFWQAMIFSMCFNVIFISLILSASTAHVVMLFGAWAIVVVVIAMSHYVSARYALTIGALNLAALLGLTIYIGRTNPELQGYFQIKNLILPTLTIIASGNIGWTLLSQHYQSNIKMRVELHKQELRTAKSLFDVNRLNAQLTAVADNSEHGLAIFDGNGHVEIMNRRFRAIFKLPDPESVDNLSQFLPEPMCTQNRMQYVHETEDGLNFLVTCHNVEWGQRQKGQMIFVTDITEKTRADRERFHSERLGFLGTLSSGIAHDFNNLLTILQNQIDLMVRRDAGMANWQNIIDMRHAIASGSALARQLLSYSHELPLTQMRVMPSELIAAVIALARPSLGENISVELNIISEAAITVDENVLQVNILNILYNSRDAMPEGGRIIIELHRVDGFVVFCFRDTGHGIDETQLDYVFEPFYSTKDRSNNVGLGLALAKSFVEKSGGRIAIASERGIGTSVNIKLPVDSGPSIAPVAKHNGDLPPTSQPRRNARILVVDDNAPLLRTQLQLLENWYAHVEGALGLHNLRAFDDLGGYDLVLCDLLLDNENGLDVLRYFRAQSFEIPFIFYSGNIPPAIRDEILAIESCPFLEKPVSTARLLDEIDAALDNKHRRPG